MAEATMQEMRYWQRELFPSLSGPPVELTEEAKRKACRALADLMMGVVRARSQEGAGEADSEEDGNE